MIATFIIEIVGMLWILWQYRNNITSRLIASILLFLALFQLAEYMVCERAVGFSSLDWAKIGFASISILPALGMHLALELSGQRKKIVTWIGYIVALVFAGFFLTIGHGIDTDQCAGNYVIFSLMPSVVYLYAAYYYLWIIVGMAFAYKASQFKTKNKKALHYLAVGYALFIVPTTVVNLVNPDTIAGIPSIMCGFAVLLALCLIFGVAPNTYELNTKKKK